MKIFIKRFVIQDGYCRARYLSKQPMSKLLNTNELSYFRSYIRCIASIYQCDCLFHDTLLNGALSTVLLNRNTQNMNIWYSACGIWCSQIEHKATQQVTSGLHLITSKLCLKGKKNSFNQKLIKSMYAFTGSAKKTKEKHCWLNKYRILLMAYMFVTDNDMSASQFSSDINYYIAPGLLDEMVTVFIT